MHRIAETKCLAGKRQQMLRSSLGGVQQHRGGIELAIAQHRNDVDALCYCLVKQRLFFFARAVQHVISHRLLRALRARMADANAKAPIIL